MKTEMVLKDPEKGVSVYFILKIGMKKKGKPQMLKMLNKASTFGI